MDMNDTNIDTGKVLEVIKSALAYKPGLVPSVSVTNPILVISFPGASCVLDLKAIDAISTALCGFLGHRGQAGVIDGNLCLSFWKDDLRREFLTDTAEPPNPDSPETIGTYCETP